MKKTISSFLFVSLILFYPSRTNSSLPILTNNHWFLEEEKEYKIQPSIGISININTQIEEVRKDNMSFDKLQFKQLIVDVLLDLEPAIPFSESAVELLMMTCAQESDFGKFLRQNKVKSDIGGYGIFQIEKATHKDIWDIDLDEANDNFLSYKKHLELLAHKYYNYNLSLEMNLRGNLPYQILIARLIYYRVRERLPNHDDIYGLGRYYKKYFNTYKGKATIEEAVKSYNYYCS